MYKTVGSVTSHSERDMIVTSRVFMSKLAKPLISRMIASTGKPVTFLDNACGSGVLVQEMQQMLTEEALKESSFLCTDSSEACTDLVKKRITAEEWVNVDTKTVDAQVCPISETR